MTPAALCIGLLALADADSGRVTGCCAYRLPDVDAVERGASCYAEHTNAAKALLDGVTVTIDCAAPADRYGRAVTSPEIVDGLDVRSVVLARGWASVRRWRGRWIDPAPVCEDAQ